MRIIAASRHNERNLGDRHASPANYFSWLCEAELVDLWDSDLRGCVSQGDSSLIIVGCLGVFGWGTGLDTDCLTRQVTFDSNLEALYKMGLPNVVLWGVGHQSRSLGNITYPEYVRSFRFVGSRDYLYATNIAMPPGYEWVPCPSCLHRVFDEPYQKTNEVVIYDHLAHPIRIDDPGIPRMDHYSATIEEVAGFLGSADTVITSSYHGAYWATLLGAKVIIPEAWSTKFLLMKHPPVIMGDARDWRAARTYAITFPEALTECRRATVRFAHQVFDLAREIGYDYDIARYKIL